MNFEGNKPAEGLSIGIIGAGRVGPSVASALRASGNSIYGVAARSADGRERVSAMLPGVPLKSAQAVAVGADVVVLAVPDEQIGAVAGSLIDMWRPGQLVLHLSGAVSLASLQSAADRGALVASLHPAMTFSGTSLDVRRLQGAAMALTASPLVLPLVEALARDMGGEPFVLSDADKPLYHAGLAHGANHLVTVLSQARDMLSQAGVTDPAQVLRPLVAAAMEGALDRGMGALTGPVTRGDRATVNMHLEALEGLDAKDTYRWLNRATASEWEKHVSQEEDHDDA